MALPSAYQKEYGHVDKIKFHSLLTALPLTFLKLDQTTPQTTLGQIQYPQARFGTSSNNTTFEADGTMVANGNATTFRDELNDLIKSANSNPAKLSINYSENSVEFATNATTSDYCVMNVQLNHLWKLGSELHPHLHWWQNASGVPNWLIQYRWQKEGNAKTTAWTSAVWDAHAFTYTSGTLNQITEFGHISAPVGYGQVSDIVQVRIIRDTNNTSGLFSGVDTYTGVASAVSFDIHIECDTLGSRTEYTK